jgi:hypothetical protein
MRLMRENQDLLMMTFESRHPNPRLSIRDAHFARKMGSKTATTAQNERRAQSNSSGNAACDTSDMAKPDWARCPSFREIARRLSAFRNSRRAPLDIMVTTRTAVQHVPPIEHILINLSLLRV